MEAALLADDPADFGLTDRQARFVDAYLGAARMNPADAARIAGYSAKSRNALRVSGFRLLMNVNVRRKMLARLGEFQITQKSVLRRIRDMAFHDMADLMDVIAEGGTARVAVDLSKAVTNNATCIIRHYSKFVNRSGKTGMRISLHDPAPYLEMLAQATGIIGGGPDIITYMNHSPDLPENWSDEELVAYCLARNIPLGDAAGHQSKAGSSTSRPRSAP